MVVKKKKTIQKKAVKKKTVQKKTIRKKTAKKKAVKKTQVGNSRIKVTLEQRHKMICEAAYYISLNKTYDTVSPTEDWLQAEAYIEKICVVPNK